MDVDLDDCVGSTRNVLEKAMAKLYDARLALALLARKLVDAVGGEEGGEVVFG